MKKLRFLFVGDLVGKPGLSLFQKWISKVKTSHNIDAVIVNGENSAKNGCGISIKGVSTLKDAGADVITTGNHAFDCKEVYTTLNERGDVLRPINYPTACPGKGYTLFNVKGHVVAIVNIQGRVFMKDGVDCPFKAAETILSFLEYKTNTIFFDLHAEATSEKLVFGYFVDGRASGVVGTHTHVQTADERVLPKGCAYITDLGCSGALNSIIGMQYQEMIKRFTIHHRFGKFAVETKGPMVLSGVIIDINAETGKAIHIERIRIIDSELENDLA